MCIHFYEEITKTTLKSSVFDYNINIVLFTIVGNDIKKRSLNKNNGKEIIRLVLCTYFKESRVIHILQNKRNTDRYINFGNTIFQEAYNTYPILIKFY